MISKQPTLSLDWAPDAIIVTAPDRSIVHLNPRAEQLFGYRCGEAAERPLEMLIADGLPRTVSTAALQRTSRQVLCAHRDGTRVAAAARWRPAPAAAGRYLIFSIREATAEDRYPSTDFVGEPARRGPDPLTIFRNHIKQALQDIDFLCKSEGARDRPATIGEIGGAIGRLLDRLDCIERRSRLGVGRTRG